MFCFFFALICCFCLDALLGGYAGRCCPYNCGLLFCVFAIYGLVVLFGRYFGGLFGLIMWFALVYVF